MAVVLRIMADRVGPQFSGLANIDPNTPGTDKSAIDQSLCNIVRRFTSDPSQIERIVRGTKLGGRQDDKTVRTDYWQRTINKAFDGQVFEQPVVFNPWPVISPIEHDAWNIARLTPDCVIDALLFADVGTWNASGGSSKTTFLLGMAIHIALNRPFCGRKIIKPGRVVFVTAEDTKEISTARLREMMNRVFPFGGCDLSEREAAINAVRDRVLIIDVSSAPVKMTTIEGTIVRAHSVNVDALIERIAPAEPVLVIVDPTVSFGVGEGRPNDAEQALIEAARMVVRRLNCAFLFVHHTGKENARLKREDMYSGRGGSSLADGSRMVFVMNSVEPKDWSGTVGDPLESGDTGIKIIVAKHSYTAPQQPIYVVRNGYSFRHVTPVEPSSVDALLEFVKAEWDQERKFSKAALEKRTKEFRLSRDKIRAAVDRLVAGGSLKPVSGPNNSQWLEPVSVADAAREIGVADA